MRPFSLGHRAPVLALIERYGATQVVVRRMVSCSILNCLQAIVKAECIAEMSAGSALVERQAGMLGANASASAVLKAEEHFGVQDYCDLEVLSSPRGQLWLQSPPLGGL